MIELTIREDDKTLKIRFPTAAIFLEHLEQMCIVLHGFGMEGLWATTRRIADVNKESET